MDSTANTCSPIADSSISARPSVRPSLRGPTVLSPSNPSERWRFTSAVLRRRRPHYFPGRLGSHGPGDTSSCLSSCPLWLYKICDTSARRAARPPVHAFPEIVRARHQLPHHSRYCVDGYKSCEIIQAHKNKTVLCFQPNKVSLRPFLLTPM